MIKADGNGVKLMQVSYMAVAARLSDAELLRRVDSLAARSRQATVELVAHLAELARRKLYLPLGYGSLYKYCVGALRLAEYAAYNRMIAARLARRFPIALQLLADGAVNLSTLRMLAPHLTRGNHLEVLKEASNRSKREMKELIARLAPQPDAAVIIRKLPTSTPVANPPAPSVPPEERAHTAAAMSPAPVSVLPPIQSALTVPSGPMATATPLAPGRYRLQFNVSRETEEKLRRVQDLLRREIPDGDPGAIFDRALTLLLEDIARRKFAVTSKPRPSRGTAPGSRAVPAKVMRAVWLRDGERCAYVGTNGRRCEETAFLEFHHVEPYAIGGESTETNVSLRCRAHNVYEAELVFGPYQPDVSVKRSTCPGASSRVAQQEGTGAAAGP